MRIMNLIDEGAPCLSGIRNKGPIMQNGSNALDALLQDRPWLLADGATGTNLFNMGLGPGDPPELWNLEHPDRIRKLYDGSVSAGADLFLTNSFGGNAARLKLHNAQNDVTKLNRAAATLGREVADAADRKIVVAGSVGPTGEIMAPMGNLTHDLAVEIFHEQADGLRDGGADILWVETMSDFSEVQAASEAFSRIGMPWVVTMSFDTSGRTMMGLTTTELARKVSKLDYQPTAFGANCGVGASDLIRTIQGLSSTVPKLPLIAKGNAGIPKYHDGHIHYDGNPALMADYATMARDSGARIIGGCCGTTPAHLVAMREALENSESSVVAPTLDQVSQKLGPFSSAADGTGETQAPRRRNRRRAE